MDNIDDFEYTLHILDTSYDGTLFPGCRELNVYKTQDTISLKFDNFEQVAEYIEYNTDKKYNNIDDIVQRLSKFDEYDISECYFNDYNKKYLLFRHDVKSMMYSKDGVNFVEKFDELDAKDGEWVQKWLRHKNGQMAYLGNVMVVDYVKTLLKQVKQYEQVRASQVWT